MPNIKSAKKRMRQDVGRRLRNNSRKNAIKTAVKKVMIAIEDEDILNAKELLRDAEAKLARAKNKRTFHAKTVSRKVSRLAKKVAVADKALSASSKAK